MRVIMFIISLAFCFNLNAQDERKYKKKVLVDGTYLFSFFKTEESRLTPLNFKLSFNEKYSFRTGFNINTSTSTNKGLEMDFKIGGDISNNYSKKWLDDDFDLYPADETSDLLSDNKFIKPIVDLKISRNEALERFSRIK